MDRMIRDVRSHSMHLYAEQRITDADALCAGRKEGKGTSPRLYAVPGHRLGLDLAVARGVASPRQPWPWRSQPSSRALLQRGPEEGGRQGGAGRAQRRDRRP